MFYNLYLHFTFVVRVFKNVLLCMNVRLSKIRLFHTYVMHRMFYFERYCTYIFTQTDPFYHFRYQEYVKYANKALNNLREMSKTCVRT